MKRLLDITLSLAGLAVSLPFCLVIAILISTRSPGSAIFAQQRVGRGKKTFTLYKFRTMAAGRPDVGTHEASASWLTPEGKFLRRTRLDEIPQLFNVLAGDMSLVGPRPCLPGQTDVISARDAAGVFSVKPGITGLAQLDGIDMSRPEELAARDADYVQQVSLIMDIRCILATVFGGSLDRRRNHQV